MNWKSKIGGVSCCWGVV